METIANDVLHPKMYVENDLNFQDYAENILEYICIHRIPIRSKYPKLVVDLFIQKTPQMDCFRDIITHLSEEEIIDKIIDSIDIWSNDTANNKCTHISFLDPTLWSILHKAFKMNENPPLREKHEKLVMQSVNTQLEQQLKHNMYSNNSDNHLNIQQTRRTRKRCQHSPRKMKYHRQFYI